MFIFALFTGIYSYSIFFLGIAGWLYRPLVVGVTGIWIVVCLWLFLKNPRSSSQSNKLLTSESDDLLGNDIFAKLNVKNVRKNWFVLVLLFLIAAQMLVNLVGALGWELAFDALWYHLTLPKLYLLQHAVYHIPGGLLYYSDMPKLGEMLYTGMLSLGSAIYAKLLHYFFGILILAALYRFSRMFFSRVLSLLCIVIMASNLVFDWEQITSYIDLIRTFYELLAVWGLYIYFKEGSKKWFYLSAVMIGLAVTTKVLAVGTLGILVCILLVRAIWGKWDKGEGSKMRNESGHMKNKKGYGWITAFAGMTQVKEYLFYILIALVIPLPWFVFSYMHTGNPVYPFFSGTYDVTPTHTNPFFFLLTLVRLFTHADDPLSPVYLIFLPLVILYFRKFAPQLKMLVVYAGLGILVWYFTPQTGGGRFVLPYLPVFSLVCTAVLEQLGKMKTNILYRYCIVLVCLVALVSIGYRGAANAKYMPVILGRESTQAFLTKHLNFSYGDFYDTDGYFRTHIKPTDRVLLINFHNLYYVDFPFIDSSWRKPRDIFNYVAVQNTELPQEFSSWNLVYSNPVTMVELYERPNIAIEMRDER